MEPFVCFIGLGSIIGGYIYFAVTKKEFNPIAIYRNSIEINKEKKYKKFNFDINYFNNLENEIVKV